MSAWWSYLLTAVGVFGLWLAGRKDSRGWIVGICAQGLWIAYATATRQWGFYVSALAYGWVYSRNAWRWRSAEPAVPVDPPEGAPAQGTVRFEMVRTGDSWVLPPIEVALDETGSFSVVLPATDDVVGIKIRRWPRRRR